MFDLRGLEPDKILERSAAADAVLLGARFQFDRERLALLGRCRVIVRYGAGVDNVDLAAAHERGVVVSCVPDYCVEEVSNHAIALLLALHRQLVGYDQAFRAGSAAIDTSHPIPRLSSLTLGIVGFGRIGREVGRKAKALGLNVAAFDPLVQPASIRAAEAEPSGLVELMRAADVVSLHVPLTSETRNLIDAGRIAGMRHGALLINVGRGGLVDEVALADALHTGQLGGAGIDVTSVEPLPAGHPLFRAPNVILTPHVAWYSTGAQRELQTKAAEEVARVLTGVPSLHSL